MSGNHAGMSDKPNRLADIKDDDAAQPLEIVIADDADLEAPDDASGVRDPDVQHRAYAYTIWTGGAPIEVSSDAATLEELMEELGELDEGIVAFPEALIRADRIDAIEARWPGAPDDSGDQDDEDEPEPSPVKSGSRDRGW